MKKYLLDTSICVFLFRGKYNIENKIDEVGFENCYISDVTLAELRYGAYKSNRKEYNLQLIDDFAKEVGVVSFAETIDVFASEKNRLRILGTPLEDFDLLIASAAISRDYILVTDNIKHFERVNNINIENWVDRA